MCSERSAFGERLVAVTGKPPTRAGHRSTGRNSPRALLQNALRADQKSRNRIPPRVSGRLGPNLPDGRGTNPGQ